MALQKQWKRVFVSLNPAGIYLLKVNNSKTRTSCLYYQRRTYFTACSSVSVVNSEHVIAGWESSFVCSNDK